MRTTSPRMHGKKLKKVAYRYIRPDDDVGQPMYALLGDLIAAHHTELTDARIALAWSLGWKPDVDGRVTLGKCRKASDLERELADANAGAYDFVIVLNRTFWTHDLVTADQRCALLDHELCHATVALDLRGEPIEDECGRRVYRIRKHDLEEFADIAARYGCWKRDIEAFADALDRAHAKTDHWIGFRSVQDALKHAGLSVSLDQIVVWSADERREAYEWALLRQDPRLRVAARMPPFLATAVSVPA